MSYEPADFVVKQGDTAPRITGTLTDGNGDPVDVTGAAVRLHMHGLTTATPLELDLDAEVDSEAVDNNVVYYDWQAGDTDLVGYYGAEWQVTFVNTQVQTFPNEGIFLVQVYEQVA